MEQPYESFKGVETSLLATAVDRDGTSEEEFLVDPNPKPN
jgi:hypothetical protein